MGNLCQDQKVVKFIGRTYRRIILKATNIYLIWNWYVDLSITHNWLGSLWHGNFWLLTIMWSKCLGKDRVFLTVQVIRYITVLPYTYRKYCLTSVYTVEEEVIPHLAYYVVVFCLKITDGGQASGRGNYYSSACDLISYLHQ